MQLKLNKIRRVFGSAQKPTAVASLDATFLGWSKVAGDNTQIISNETKVTTALSLYPVFEDQLTVTFGQPTGTVVTYEGTTTVSVVTGTTFGAINRPTPTASGKYFDGWYTDASCTTAITSTTEINNSLSIYPKMVSLQWTEITLTAGNNTTFNSLSKAYHNENEIIVSVVDLVQTVATEIAITFSMPSGYKIPVMQIRGVWTTRALTPDVSGTLFTYGSTGTIQIKLLNTANALNQNISFQLVIPITKV